MICFQSGTVRGGYSGEAGYVNKKEIMGMNTCDTFSE